MKIKLKTLTPVHIGSGEAISPIEYFAFNSKSQTICKENFHNADKLFRVDMNGLFEDPEFRNYQNKFIESAKFQKYIGALLPENLLLKHTLYSIDISYKARSSNFIEIKEFIKSAGRVFIPGSSLKGSILSGVIENILKEKNIESFRSYKEHLGEVLSEITHSSGKPDLREFSHWLDVRDTNLKSPYDSLEVSYIEVVGGRIKTKFPLLYEVLKPGIEFEAEIISHSNKSEKDILKMANDFYKKVYEKEKAFSHKMILPEISSDTFLLRIGQGSTAWATSFLILAEELDIKNYQIQRPKFHKVSGPPRTKKLIEGAISMGWISIKIIE